MPPSTPTASMSPGRLALLEQATTPLRQQMRQQEAAIVKERYLGHAMVSSLVCAIATFDRFWLDNSLLALLTRDALADQLTHYLNLALIVFCLTWAVLAGYYSFHSIEGEERGGVRKGRGEEQGSKKSTVLTSTPALSGTSLPMTPQRGGGRLEDQGVISPIFPIPEKTIFGTPQQSPTPGALRNRRADYRPMYGASSPSRPDLSWIDDHDFGGGARAGGVAGVNRSALSFSSARSHSASFASQPASPAPTGTAMIADLASSAPFQSRVAALPSTKMLTSIHTQEQVDALLAKSRADMAAASAAGAAGDKLNQSTSFYQAMLQLDGLELHPYQMSKDPAEGKTDPYDVIYDSNGGVHLSPRSTGISPTGSDDTSRFRVELAAQRAAAVAAASAAGGASPIDGRRRRLSHASSPSRGMPGEGPSSGGGGGGSGERGGTVGRTRSGPSALTESELTRAEQRLRIWMVNTIVRPLNEGIKAMNKRFETDLAPLHLRLGVSTVEQITAAMAAHPELVQTQLPYLLPYLRLHANQAYLVARISSLALGSCMADFSWASGGAMPTETGTVVGGAAGGGAGGEKAAPAVAAVPSSLSARLAPRPWNDSLPTDTQLVLSLFSAYMDTRLTACAIVQSHNVDQPFSSRYTLVSPAKPTALHQSAGAFYVHLATLNPPSLEFVSVASDGQSTITKLLLFRALVLFLSHAAYENNGMIDRLALSGPSLNLDMVLNGF